MMSNQMTGRWYPVAISGQRFTPVGQNNLSGYSLYDVAYTALENYADSIERKHDPPYAIIFIQNTFDWVAVTPVPPVPQKFHLQDLAVDPWEFLAS